MAPINTELAQKNESETLLAIAFAPRKTATCRTNEGYILGRGARDRCNDVKKHTFMIKQQDQTQGLSHYFGKTKIISHYFGTTKIVSH